MMRLGRLFYPYVFVGFVCVLYYVWRLEGSGIRKKNDQRTENETCQDWRCWKSAHPVSKQDEWQLVCDEELGSKRSASIQQYPAGKVIAPDDEEGYDKDMDVPSWSVIYSKHGHVENGGRFASNNSTQKPKIVIVIPYRDRRVHLKIFLDYMHSFLQKQKANYVIYVVEMESEGHFRKGITINAGFLEVMKRENTSCVIFHDVDMLPVDDNNVYYCDETVRHYVAYRSPATFVKSTLRFISQKRVNVADYFFGGVAAFPVHLFRAINGFTNLLSGWGGADDEILQRILSRKIPLTRLRADQWGYYVLSHVRQPDLVNRQKLVGKARTRLDKDGLSSVRYDVQAIEERKLYTWILIKTKPPSCFYPGFVEKYVNQTLYGFRAIGNNA